MAAKVFDGLFLGDAETSMDADFLDLNKISRLINVAGRQVHNALSGHGFVYKTYYWEDESNFLVFPAMEKDKSLLEMIDFIDSSLRKGLSVLLFSDRGVSRNAYGVCAFLMFKYHWGFEKSYDFVVSKKKDIQINQGFIQQLFTLEKRLTAKRKKEFQGSGSSTDSELLIKERLRRKEWDPSYLRTARSSSALSAASITKIYKDKSRTARPDELSDDEAEDELLLVNSYLNSKNTLTTLPGPYRGIHQVQKSFKLRFNGLLLEEDVHVFPTSPPSRYNPPSVPRGILKWNRRRADHTGVDDIKFTSASSSGHESDSKVHGSRTTTATATASPRRHAPAPAPAAIEREKVTKRSIAAVNSMSPALAPTQREREVNVRPLQASEDNLGAVDGSQHRRSQHPPASLPLPVPVARSPIVPELFITAASSAEGAWATDAYRNSREIRSSLTAEDCMRSIMRDLRGSSSALRAEEKTTGNSNSNSNNNNNNSNSNSNSSSIGNSSGYRETSDDFTTSNSERALMRSIAALKDRRADMDFAYEDMGALSLQDLAALPLHFEDPRASRRDIPYDSGVSRFDSMIGYSGRRESPAPEGFNQVLSVEEMDAADEWTSRGRQLAADTTHFPSSSTARSRRGEVREVDEGAPLAAFQRGGQEGAIRVKYSSFAPPNGSRQPNNDAHSAWQEDSFRGSSDKRPQPQLQQHRASTSSSATKRRPDLNSDRSSLPTDRKEDRAREAPARTYRHGSPAPSRVTTPRAPPPPPFPSSSPFVVHRVVRASSPSVSRMRDPSPAPGTIAWGSSNLARSRDAPASRQLQRQSSSDSEYRDRGRGAFMGSEVSHDVSATTYKASSRLSSGGSVVKASRPASPGIRRKSSSGDLYGVNQNYSNGASTGRSATPTRGSWR